MNHTQYMTFLKTRKSNVETAIRELLNTCDLLCKPRALTAEKTIQFLESQARLDWDRIQDDETQANDVDGILDSEEIRDQRAGIQEALASYARRLREVRDKHPNLHEQVRRLGSADDAHQA